MTRFGRSIDHRRHGGDPRLFNIVEQQLGGAEDVEPGELEVVPRGPAVGVALEQVDLGGKHVEPDRLLLAVEPRPTIAVFDPQAVLGLPLLPLADRLLPAIPRAAGILGDLEQRLLQVELRADDVQPSLPDVGPEGEIDDRQVVERAEDQPQRDPAVVRWWCS